MSTKRLWAIAGAAVGIVAILILVLTLAIGPGSDPEPTPTPTPTASASPTPTSTPTATASPAPTFTAPGEVAATCENTSTAELRAQATSIDWVPWELPDQADGVPPFGIFPNGAPDGAIVCRWGVGPDIPTDNVTDLAWAPIDPENAVAAMQMLETEGYTRTDTRDGVYLSLRAAPGLGDDDGWGATYLFTVFDVRWAMTRADVDDDVKAPTEDR